MAGAGRVWRTFRYEDRQNCIDHDLAFHQRVVDSAHNPVLICLRPFWNCP